MIISGVLGLFFDIFSALFSGLEFIGLPLDLINVLGSILSYGVWIIGADLMAIIITTIIGWWTIKFTVGLVIWIWELLPLT